MAKVTVKIYNKNATASKLKSLFWAKAYPVIREMQKSDCNTYVRKQSGVLADSIDDGPGPHDIQWRARYAKKVYYTGTPKKNVNPNASLRWCEVAKRKYAKEWAEAGSNAVNGG